MSNENKVSDNSNGIEFCPICKSQGGNYFCGNCMNRAPQATGCDARCKFCQQLPNMEGDCRCDLDPPQAAMSDLEYRIRFVIEARKWQIAMNHGWMARNPQTKENMQETRKAEMEIESKDAEIKLFTDCLAALASTDSAPQAASKLDLIKARIKGNGKTVELQSPSTDSVTKQPDTQLKKANFTDLDEQLAKLTPPLANRRQLL